MRASGNGPHELRLPLGLVVDLVANVYLFHHAARAIDRDLGDQFAIERRIADSGPWWRLVYGRGLHGAIKQVAARASEIARMAPGHFLTASEEDELLPYLAEVRDLLAVWRDERTAAEDRRREVGRRFPLDVQRLLSDAGGDRSQFAETDRAGDEHGLGDLFTHLDACPVPAAPGPLSLSDGAAYWGWLDSARAFRTFAREDGVRNPRVRRMQQAVRFHGLVARASAAADGIDLTTVVLRLDDESEAFLDRADLGLVAMVADCHGADPLFDQYDAGIFVEHTSPGDALRALRTHLGWRRAGAPRPRLRALVMAATAANIDNHIETLAELVPSAADIAERLRQPSIEAGEPSLLRDARVATDHIARLDPRSRRASAGMRLLLAGRQRASGTLGR